MLNCVPLISHRKRYFASLSFGKDSTGLVLMLIEKKYPLDEVVFFNTGMEFKALYQVRDMLVPYLESLGIKYTELHPEKPFLWNMLERPVCKRGTDIVHKHGYSWCGGTCRWGTSMKLAALKKYTKDGWDYVGLAADEPHRFNKEYRPNRILPLAEWGITEKEALEYCYSMGIHWQENGIPLYEILDRVSCWFCGNKNLKELRNIYLYLPEYWKKLKQLQERTPFPYRRKEQMTIFQLEERFIRESKNKNTVISMGKGNSVPNLPGKVMTSLRENLHTSLRSDSIFPQNLAGQGTELRNAHEITVCLQAK